MSKRNFYIYVSLLAALILLSVSPFAFVGGFIVVAFVYLPMMLLIGAMGFEITGQTHDDLIFAVFSGASVILVMIAFWLFYLAADRADKGEPDRARIRGAIALTLLAIPVLVYFSFKALPGI